MAIPAPTTHVGRLSRAVTAGGVGLGLAALAAPAAHAVVAVPPGVQVVDEAGVLSSSEEQRLTQDIQQMRRETGQNLYVVYVDQFGVGGSQGVVEDVNASRPLGSNDQVLAIAVEEGLYGFDAGSALNRMQGDITSAYIGPALPTSDPADWLAPAEAAIAGVDDAADGALDGRGASGAQLDPGGPLPAGAGAGGAARQDSGQQDAAPSDGAGGPLTGLLGAGAVAAAVAGGVAVARGRKRKDGGEARGREVAAGPAAPRDPLDALPVEELRTKAGSKLVAADDAIRSSEQELGFAMASYGEKSVGTFREDLDKAKEHMRASFQLQHQLDDEIPDTEADQRSWLKEIIARCDEVGAALAAHEKEFNSLRDLENRVPEALAGIAAKVPAAEERVRRAESALVALHGSYAESALAEVKDNAAQARQRIEFVRTAEAKAKEAWNSGDRSTAALAVRAAEESLAQVDTLTAAVDGADQSLRTMLQNVHTGIAQSEQDVAEAEAVVRSGAHSDLAGPVAGMKQTLTTVRSSLASGRPDPLDLLRRLEAAHRQLDVPLSSVRDGREQARQAAQMLQAAIAQAQAQIDGTASFIGARRGAVGSEARTRLAEADRALQTAMQLGGSDPVTALQHAQRASQLADRASELAQEDVSGFGYGGGMGTMGYGPGMGYQRSGVGGGFAGGLGGALLGGILMNSMLGGGHHDSWGGGGFGGFDGGGLGGGDFGGFGDISGGGF